MSNGFHFPTRDPILNAVTDPDVHAAFRSTWGCAVLATRIFDASTRPDYVRLLNDRAEWIAAAFNTLRSEYRPGRVEKSIPKLTRVSALPVGYPGYGTAHEEADDLVALFIREVERASDRRAGFHHRCPGYTWPPLTAAAVMRMRIRLSVILKRRRPQWQRLAELTGLLERESSQAGAEPPRQFVTATRPSEPPPVVQRVHGCAEIVAAWRAVAEMQQTDIGTRWRKIKRDNAKYGGPIEISGGRPPRSALVLLQEFAADPPGWAKRKGIVTT
ncbi:hypothetical protein [Limnoglobus roseus]|uniref:Uncharacterized protein n=1 Tax=Limnoglobus roseus TaxID=2598579 RepID=A0A5C1AF44_9BACT|nr:hypothetical protein [Limnoglobus roseus]QEL15618.1 hypothetical protein PX52LOC_02551 [Limnoglobus roseus]